MQAEPTATAAVFTTGEPSEEMKSLIGLSVGSDDIEGWEEVRPPSTRRTIREKTKADDEILISPNSPYTQVYLSNQPQSSSTGYKGSTSDPSVSQGYLPTAVITTQKTKSKAVDLNKVSHVAVAKHLEVLVSKGAITRMLTHPKTGKLAITTATVGYLAEVLQITQLGP